MTDCVIELQGVEGDIRAFRDELIDTLKRQGVGTDQVTVSVLRAAKRPLTEPAPLGHAEWMEVLITIAVPVATSGATTLVTELIKKWVANKRVKPKAKGKKKS